MSGPLLDRIDLHVAMSPVPWSDLDAPGPCEASVEVRARVIAARALQERRGRKQRLRTNAEIPDEAMDALVAATPDARRLLGRAVERLGLSARAARRVLKVARSIADLGGDSKTGPTAVAEALSYRDGAAP